MAEIVPVRMPKLTMAATQATFVDWLVADGGPVAEGEPIYTVSTDKVETRVEAPASGVLRHGEAEFEVDYPVGTQLGSIEKAG
ncbi:biotin/lipoyl-containing protein [Amycolatopsis acididurans]|uniref:biotin/lipoyl-containing protein n=1 Tax=Amycolatopsis acididurans TaxID=2724524 RepID=UPI001B31FFB0|nr:biotin/lipoyl-containing protein [Amycolatopsis acididurans]